MYKYDRAFLSNEDFFCTSLSVSLSWAAAFCGCTMGYLIRGRLVSVKNHLPVPWVDVYQGLLYITITIKGQNSVGFGWYQGIFAENGEIN